MKLHPLSIPVRAVVGMQLSNLVIAGGAAFAGQGAIGVTGGVVTGLVILAVILGFRLIRETLYYRRFEYALTDDTFDIGSGIVSRRERNIPLRRIQNVDITQDVIARAVGLAAVSLETAGGGSNNAEGEVRYVGKNEADRLQNEIQRLKGDDTATVPERHEETATHGSVAESDSGPVAAPDDVLFELSTRDLLLVSAFKLNLRPLGPVVVAGVAAAEAFPTTQISTLIGHPGLSALVLAVATAVLGPVETFARYYDFRLWRSGDELRYERGLVSRYTGSIPFEKIQNLILGENVLMRRFGYATLDVETAGYGSASATSRGSESVVPLAERGAVLDFARSIEGFEFGEMDFARPPKRARRRYVGRYLIAIAAVTGVLFVAHRLLGVGVLRWWFVPLALVVAIPFAAHYKWQNRGVRAGDEYVLTCNGFWYRYIEVVPYYRVQTVIAERSIFQRRWNLATVVIDTAGSRNLSQQSARAVDFDRHETDDLRETVRRRLRKSVIERRAKRRRVRPGEA